MVVEEEHEEAGLFPRLHKRTQHSIAVQWTYIRDDSEYFDGFYPLLSCYRINIILS